MAQLEIGITVRQLARCRQLDMLAICYPLLDHSKHLCHIYGPNQLSSSIVSITAMFNERVQLFVCKLAFDCGCRMYIYA
jgi:hypothetical protein